jgi:hypothetical protein
MYDYYTMGLQNMPVVDLLQAHVGLALLVEERISNVNVAWA